MIGNIGDQPIGDRQAEFVAGYARLIAEIRARQPQAKILILPPFPRGRLRREEWRTVADAWESMPCSSKCTKPLNVRYRTVRTRFGSTSSRG